MILGDPGELDRFVRLRRQEGYGWRQVALDVRDRTGVAVTHETLRVWYGEQERVA